VPWDASRARLVSQGKPPHIDWDMLLLTVRDVTRHTRIAMTGPSSAVVQSLKHSFETSTLIVEPYKHWVLKGCLPDDVATDVISLPFQAPSLAGVSGKRELHNNTRTYFDAANQARFASVKSVSEALQDPATTGMIERRFGINLKGAYLRIEYAMDVDEFWLEPHTDLGVKLFTMLLYLSTDPRHRDLGTDIYDANKKHVSRPPFESNSALVFVPSNNTFHGFEKRKIEGVRKSVIINYVTNEWKAREQLAFPSNPI